MKGVIVYDRFAGHFYIPYGMKEGQQPLDIRNEFRTDWVPLEYAHKAIPGNIAWYHGCWLEVDASLDDVLAENISIKTWRSHLRHRLMLAGIKPGMEALAIARAA